jgi:ankyrin repeat/BTB/POZ domain-containing protein 1
MRYKSGGRPLYYETRYIIKHYDMVLRKDELEVQLKDEHQLIRDGKLRDDSPLDVSEEFGKLCDACRVGDLKGCQEAITTGVNINARDYFDYTPLILVSLT